MDLILTLIAVFGVGSLMLITLALATGTMRWIPNHKVGIREKLLSTRGSVQGGFIALDGEAGFEPEIVRGGWHLFWPFQYRVHLVSLVTIPQGTLGYVYARDGRPLDATQALGADVGDMLDVRQFLTAGGQRGPQRRVLREGTYAINLAQFIVFTQEQTFGLVLDREDAQRFRRMVEIIAERDGFAPVVLRGTDDQLGVVTVHDGGPLAPGEIIAPIVDARGHENFQSPEAFLAAGGRRGRQLQVIVEGTWYINRLFATVERIPKTVVEVGTVGVVVSYTGRTGDDRSGTEYTHGELVDTGHRGVWSEPLLPGKYAFNTYAGKVIAVPTTNFILKWQKAAVGAHRFDENLAEVSLITRDAFEPMLPLSVVVHIDYRKAPLVIQRFGDVKRLVEQTLDPMVAAYFKNIGQNRTLIQLIHDRAAIQQQSSEEMRLKFERYNLQLEEVLIGTPSSASDDGAIEQILGQIRSRQLADEQVETYSRQQIAAVKERELREAESHAQQQRRITESELNIQVQRNDGAASYQRATQEAEQVRCLAAAEANKIEVIGLARARAAKEQVAAYGGPRWQVTQQVMGRMAEAIEKTGVQIVPRVVVGQSQGAGNALESLLAMLLADSASGASSVQLPPGLNPHDVLAAARGAIEDHATKAPGVD